ncbi:LacI family DNA-binding transcriptional regulator [Streptomyces lasiicapitis]|uniref:LacI family DNA-binding transcriptional regulator n=1 Tax=Streptomyces TaxID=1883 RepID=UPI0013DD01F6|nr:LacI family DNA-binding transcriptional regulator [Streptomyces aureoverticillatus]QIB48352.1 LacI family transcriptional regulator [Streptomyces aureoverticillatus]
MTGTTATPPPPRRGTGRRPTMADVARAAGVNPSTVSRALDDRHPFSRSDTAARIKQIAAQLGYTPNPAAANLRRQSTRTIGVVMSSITGTVMAMLYEEIAEACRDHGLDALLATTRDDLEAETALGRLLLNRRVDGLILATARLDASDGFLTELAADGTPYVLALRTDGHSPAVVGDDRLGGYLAARHLLDLGHRRIGMIAGPPYASNALGRVTGLREALTEAGIEVDESLVRSSGFSMESGESTAAELLALPDGQRPTALVTVNDNTAVGALAAARRHGLAVPRDLSVVGYNDTPLAARLPIPLTSVRVPLGEIGRGAVDMLLRIMQERPVRSLVHAPTLIPRESTAPAP